VANGSRGQVLALDPQERSLTLRLDSGQEATLDGRYLDHRPTWWTRGNPRRRTIDLGYASTSHRSQGVTLERALVRVAGAEDNQRLYVAATRAARQTTSFDVIAPEPRPIELELDVPQAQLDSIHEDLIAVGRRDGAKQLAVDTAAPLALRQMSKRQLRAERDRVAALLRDAPRPQPTAPPTPPISASSLSRGWPRPPPGSRRPATGWPNSARAPGGSCTAASSPRPATTWPRPHRGAARPPAGRPGGRPPTPGRRAQQQHLTYKERHAGLLAADRARARELAWRNRADLRTLKLERPGWLRELGQPPASIKGQRAWRQAATHILQYRERYSITDPDHALGPEPRYADLEQRRHHRATRRVIERLRDRQRTQRDQQIGRRERAHPDQPRSRSSRTDRTCSARVDQRERGGREREAG
jgi:hypothetical protein